MITTALILLILASLWIGLYQIVKQQGRILLRLDQIEGKPQPVLTKLEEPSQEAEPVGLPPETDFPAFSFPDLSGRAVGLAEFRGKRVLLVHWNFECGFCDSIAPELAALETSFEKANVALVLLAYGDAAFNQKGAAEHGLQCSILLMKDNGSPKAFEHRGTPVAYLLDEKGRVDAPFASGADGVLSLARAVVGLRADATLPVPTGPSGVSASNELRSPLETEFPTFRYPALDGGMVALEDFRGRGVLLVQWSFESDFCTAIAPQLSRLVADLEERNVRLVLLASGDDDLNRERAAAYGLKCPILLPGNGPKPQPFENRGTPVAYLLDEAGRVASPFASGTDQVLSLAREAAIEKSAAPQGDRLESPGTVVPNQSLAPAGKPHQIKLPGFLIRGEIGLGDVIKRMTSAFGIKPCVGCERRSALLNRWMSFSGQTGTGLRAGDRAPLFRLSDLQGRTIALEEYRGRRVLLVFTDPQCGPCDELAPHLVRLHNQHEKDGLAVIVVGRGDAEENRRKVEMHGFEFPVVIQPKWKLSKEYGILATPVGFLIGEDGVIAQDVAVGRDPILALAKRGQGEKHLSA